MVINIFVPTSGMGGVVSFLVGDRRSGVGYSGAPDRAVVTCGHNVRSH